MNTTLAGNTSNPGRLFRAHRAPFCETDGQIKWEHNAGGNVCRYCNDMYCVTGDGMLTKLNGALLGCIRSLQLEY